LTFPAFFFSISSLNEGRGILGSRPHGLGNRRAIQICGRSFGLWSPEV
jgi:hypothetical protein